MTDTQSQSCNEQIENNDDCSDMSLEENDEYYIEPLVVQLPSHNINKFEEQKMSECNINQELVNQLLNMEVGSKHQIINAMNVVNDRNDMNQLLDYLTFINERCETSTMKNSDKNNLETFTNAINEMEEKSQVDHEFKENININYNEAMQFKYDEEYPVLPLIIPNNCVYDENTNTITKNSQQNRNTLKIHQPAIEFIRNISAKIATISISGPARQGKSLVAGELYAPKHIPCPFDLGHTMDACTYGVWVSAKPIKHPHEQDTVILILDVEGTGFYEATKHNDMQLMVITLLISSYFIYNSIGTFTAAAMEELEFITELSDCIKMTPNDQNGNGLENILPNFMWLLRDVHLESTINGKAVPIKEYFTRKVLKFSSSKSAINKHRQHIRRVFLESFSKYDAFKLPAPHSNKNILNSLGNSPRNQLEPEFIKELDILCKKVIKEAKCKILYIDDEKQGINQYIHCTGPHFAEWITECVKYVNDPNKIPVISSITSTVMLSVFRNSKQKAILQYKELLKIELSKLRKNNDEQPLHKKEIIDLHLRIFNKIMRESASSLQGILLQQNNEPLDENENPIITQQTQIYNELCNEIGHNYVIPKIGQKGILKNVLEENMILSEKYCNQFLNNFFETVIKQMMDKSEQYSVDDVLSEFKTLRSLYYQACNNPATSGCWKKFENDKKTQSMEQFKQMRGFNVKLLEMQNAVMENERQFIESKENELRIQQQMLQQQELYEQQIIRMEDRIGEQNVENEQRMRQQQEQKNNVRKAGWIGHIACTALGVGLGLVTQNWVPAANSGISLIKYGFNI
eukprot:61993_1